jgi:alpha-tubulin suppressor-like RCC1 family protein
MKEDEDYSKIFVWGRGGDGLLGCNENLKDVLIPTKISDLDGVNLCHLAIGEKHVIALTENGDVYSWGWNNQGQLGTGDFNNRLTPTIMKALSLLKALEKIRFIDAAAGYEHSIVLGDDGSLYSWGSNNEGQLGIGKINENCLNTPSLIYPLTKEKIIKVACGSLHSLCLTNRGEVYSWGNTQNGRCGFKSNENFI